GTQAGPRRRGDRAVDAAAVNPRTSLANGPAVVQVVKSDGTIESREVRVGLVSRVTAQIVSGLEPGDRIVVGQRAAAPASAAKPATGNRPQGPSLMPPRV